MRTPAARATAPAPCRRRGRGTQVLGETALAIRPVRGADPPPRDLTRLTVAISLRRPQSLNWRLRVFGAFASTIGYSAGLQEQDKHPCRRRRRRLRPSLWRALEASRLRQPLGRPPTRRTHAIDRSSRTRRLRTAATARQAPTVAGPSTPRPIRGPPRPRRSPASPTGRLMESDKAQPLRRGSRPRPGFVAGPDLCERPLKSRRRRESARSGRWSRSSGPARMDPVERPEGLIPKKLLSDPGASTGPAQTETGRRPHRRTSRS